MAQRPVSESVSHTAAPPAGWTNEERRVLKQLKSPEAIQNFLDETPYSTEDHYRSPRTVLRERRAHCFDGAVFAAAALRALGDPALLVDLRSIRDDDHVITIFRRRGRVGSISKSNFVGLRYREPVYRDVRELVMSYFDQFYNLAREKTLRAYSDPLDLRRYDRAGWMFEDKVLDAIALRLDQVRHHSILTAGMVRGLSLVDKRTYDAGLQGADRAGLYQIKGG